MDKQHCNVDYQSPTLMIEGDLTLATMSLVLSKINSLTFGEMPQNIDLTRLNLCDSSAVALALDLKRRGVFHVLHAPPAFAAIVRACQMGVLFPDLAQD